MSDRLRQWVMLQNESINEKMSQLMSRFNLETGGLLGCWGVEKLKEGHESIPRNPLLFKQFFWVRYVADVGGGSVDVIRRCGGAGLPEPEFKQGVGSFITTIWRSVLAGEYLECMGLNERQRNAVKHIGRYGRITRAEYEVFCIVSERTANRELDDLSSKKLIERKGRGPETYYVLARFGEIGNGVKSSGIDGTVIEGVGKFTAKNEGLHIGEILYGAGMNKLERIELERRLDERYANC